MLIDFHTHAFPDKLAQRALASLSTAIHIEPHTDGTVPGLISRMDAEGVDRAVICNIATNPKQTGNVNDFAIETKRQFGERVIPLGSLHPCYENTEAEITRLHDAGIQGLKIHPDYMGVEIDDPAFDGIFSLAASFNMFIVTHAGFDVYSPDKIWATPDGILRRLQRSPDARLVCAHYGGNQLYDQVEEKLIGQNLYIDTSLATVSGLEKKQAERILLGHDPDKILFGSDCPWCSSAATFQYVDSLAIPSALKDKIYYANALKLLGET